MRLVSVLKPSRIMLKVVSSMPQEQLENGQYFQAQTIVKEVVV